MSSRTKGDAGTKPHKIEGETVEKLDIKNVMHSANAALDNDELRKAEERLAYSLGLARKMIAQEAQRR